MRAFLVAAWLFILLPGIFLSATAQKRVVTMGVVIDGPWSQNEAIRQTIESEIAELTSGEFDVRFPADKRFVADWSVAGVKIAVDRLLADRKVDFVLAMGVIASQDIALRGPLPKPVIAPFVLDLLLQDLPRKNGTSGVKNLNYIAIPSNIERDIRCFREIVPFKKLTFLINAGTLEAVPGIQTRCQTIVEELGLTVTTISVNTLQDALSVVNHEHEAIYIAPLLNLPQQDFLKLINAMRERSIPTFSLMGRNEVEAGILAGLNPDIFPRISRRVAINVQRILLGDDPGDIPYAFAPGEELCINMATARQIGIYPSWGLITDAVLIDEERSEIKRQLTLESAIREGLAANQDLLAAGKGVRAGAQDVRIATAGLLPQLSVSATGVKIDEDRAGIFQAEETVTGSIALSQVLFSDDALANRRLQKHLQEAREQGYAATEQDIALAVATAYLQMLNAKTFERIQKENLKLTRSNLELARVRESVGASGRSDVYRWESQIATNRGSLIAANAARNVAEIQLNQLLHRPLEENFLAGETGIDDVATLGDKNGIFPYIDNPFSFKVFRNFLEEEAVRQSPEIRQLDESIAAQRRLLSNANRSFLLPSIVAQAEFSRFLIREGTGSEGFTIDPASPLAVLGDAFSTGDDNNWSIALNASLPLFSGGARFANRSKILETLDQLQYQRRALVEKIQLRSRTAAHFTGSSYAAIRQSHIAAEAAHKNLDLVVDAYSQGVVAVIELLDAQNVSLVADQAAAGSVYQFLIELVQLERSLGKLYLLSTATEREALFKRLDDYFLTSGVPVRR